MVGVPRYGAIYGGLGADYSRCYHGRTRWHLQLIRCSRTSASRISSFNGEREDVERVLSDDDFSAPSNALEEPWYDAWDDADGEEIPVAMPPITE